VFLYANGSHKDVIIKMSRRKISSGREEEEKHSICTTLSAGYYDAEEQVELTQGKSKVRLTCR